MGVPLGFTGAVGAAEEETAEEEDRGTMEMLRQRGLL